MSDYRLTPPRNERRDAAENRQRIIDAALHLFDLHGVEQVSMNQIATEAQIGPGTLYRRYRNKSELCQDLIKDSVDMLFDDIYEAMEAHKEEPAGGRLRRLLGFFLRFREKKAQLLKGIENASPPTGKRAYSPIYQELHQQLVLLFEEIHGTKPGGVNSVFKADMLLHALGSEAYLFQRQGRGLSPETILEQLCLTFIPDEAAKL
ncbi:TetR/AcrR family transcriptional regulator [Paenibacillus whitsoniae]|uniref:TetR/AcrR family transcriptional regulator n=1 Tax=Paenibacillus whitsoniae TaxID=2496558 RepID=A0A3S0CBB6_9BACL|nr:TetR/AcrR family transcriptional regulator [Paenibacillus whitsoniae]RTE09028.1 TetR/AcrR family transcriptional regulator [Paenibacillus whitsoniae]